LQVNRVFQPRGFFTVPDGTQVSAFLNATDSSQGDIPPNALGDVSVAAGKIGPGVRSWVHVHPVVTNITYVTAGALTVRMKETGAVEYDVHVTAGQAVLIEPGTLLQLRNDGDDEAEVLYIVSPSYVFEADGDDSPIYDDAVVVFETWEELRQSNYSYQTGSESLENVLARRDQSLARLAAQRK
jgi:mannose-6-phosphate isomerase-like protein (cupin superfamily)